MRTLLLLLFPLYTLAQSPAYDQVQQDLRVLATGNQSLADHVVTFDARYEGVEGSPFLWEGWAVGEIFLSENRNINKNIQFRFDVAENELHVRSKTDSTVVKILDNAEIITVAVRSPQGAVTLRQLDIPGEADDRLYMQQYLGEQYELLVLPVKKLRKADYNHPIAGLKRSDEWLYDEKYFIRKGNNFTKVKLTRNSLKKALPKRLEKELEKPAYDEITVASVVRLLRQAE